MNSVEIGLLTAVPWVFSAIGALLLPRFATTASMSKKIALAAMIGIIVGYIIGAIGGPVLGSSGSRWPPSTSSSSSRSSSPSPPPA